jgi:UDP-glucuronate 4-epimerase
MKLDFTYIDDIVEGVARIIQKPTVANPDWDKANPDVATSWAPYHIYNFGNNQVENLTHFIDVLEFYRDKKAKKIYLPMQDGDVPATFANVDDLVRDFDFKPSTSIETGLENFVKWYLGYYR